MAADPTLPITFAHRGARAHHPENTLAAFRFALEQGAGGLETDAWLSGDGDVVLVHDPWVWARRLGVLPRRVEIRRTSTRALRRLGIPTLRDLYEELGSGYQLSIDLKVPAVGEQIIALARERDAVGRLWLCSPSRRRLRDLRAHEPSVHLVHSQARSRLPSSLERHAADLARSRIDAMNLHRSEWNAGMVTMFHRFSVLAFAWDTQEVRQLRSMLDIGIDALYCDHVDRMVATVTEWRAHATRT